MTDITERYRHTKDVDQDRVDQFIRAHRDDPDTGLLLLFEWVKTKVVNRRTFTICIRALEREV